MDDCQGSRQRFCDGKVTFVMPTHYDWENMSDFCHPSGFGDLILIAHEFLSKIQISNA